MPALQTLQTEEENDTDDIKQNEVSQKVAIKIEKEDDDFLQI